MFEKFIEVLSNLTVELKRYNDNAAKPTSSLGHAEVLVQKTTPEVAPEVAPEVTLEVAPEVTAKAAPKAAPKATPKPIPKAEPEAPVVELKDVQKVALDFMAANGRTAFIDVLRACGVPSVDEGKGPVYKISTVKDNQKILAAVYKAVTEAPASDPTA